MNGSSTSHSRQFTMAADARKLTADIEGFAELAALHHQLGQLSHERIFLKFSSIDSRMVAPLDIVLRHAEFRRNTIEYAVGTECEPVRRPDGLQRLRLDQAIDLSRHTAKLIAGFGERISNSLQRKIYESVDELFSNAALHSRSELGVSAKGVTGEHAKQFYFTIADGGHGIPGSVRNALVEFASDEEAIAWAMTPNHTTKRSNIPGGLGSLVLRTFVESNCGRLVVASRGGFWCQTGIHVMKKPLQHVFPGTAVILEVVSSDSIEYDSTSRTNSDNIW